MKIKTALHEAELDTLQSKKQRSYNDIVDFFDANWQANRADSSLHKLQQLDQALGSPSKKVAIIVVGGTNGKSLTSVLPQSCYAEENF